ncbi:MAG: M14 family zinc carboxypeptidase, partial [Phycisphaerae bacterium]
MAGSKAVSPTPSEVEAHVLRLRRDHPRLVRVDVAGVSQRGRPIYAATVTSPAAGDADKQHALIVAGQHGNEESGRMLALATLDWLVSRAGGETRRKQKVVVMPCVNPDGAEADTHLTPSGVAPNLDHGPGGAVSPEGIAVERIADALEPELFVDMHARGYAGCSYDMVLYPGTKVYTEDDHLLHAIAAEMAAAGEKAGVPQIAHPLTWPGWGGDDPDHASTTRYAYRRFKSLVFLTETCEDNSGSYPAADRIASGMAKIKALLAHGNRRHPKLYYSGYPCCV